MQELQSFHFLADIDAESQFKLAHDQIKQLTGKDIQPGIKVVFNMGLIRRLLCKMFGWVLHMEVKGKNYFFGTDSLRHFLTRNQNLRAISTPGSAYNLSQEDLAIALRDVISTSQVRKKLIEIQKSNPPKEPSTRAVAEQELTILKDWTSAPITIYYGLLPDSSITLTPKIDEDEALDPPAAGINNQQASQFDDEKADHSLRTRPLSELLAQEERSKTPVLSTSTVEIPTLSTSTCTQPASKSQASSQQSITGLSSLHNVQVIRPVEAPLIFEEEEKKVRSATPLLTTQSLTTASISHSPAPDHTPTLPSISPAPIAADSQNSLPAPYQRLSSPILTQGLSTTSSFAATAEALITSTIPLNRTPSPALQPSLFATSTLSLLDELLSTSTAVPSSASIISQTLASTSSLPMTGETSGTTVSPSRRSPSPALTQTLPATSALPIITEMLVTSDIPVARSPSPILSESLSATSALPLSTDTLTTTTATIQRPISPIRTQSQSSTTSIPLTTETLVTSTTPIQRPISPIRTQSQSTTTSIPLTTETLSTTTILVQLPASQASVTSIPSATQTQSKILESAPLHLSQPKKTTPPAKPRAPIVQHTTAFAFPKSVPAPKQKPVVIPEEDGRIFLELPEKFTTQQILFTLEDISKKFTNNAISLQESTKGAKKEDYSFSFQLMALCFYMAKNPGRFSLDETDNSRLIEIMKPIGKNFSKLPLIDQLQLVNVAASENILSDEFKGEILMKTKKGKKVVQQWVTNEANQAENKKAVDELLFLFKKSVILAKASPSRKEELAILSGFIQHQIDLCKKAKNEQGLSFYEMIQEIVQSA